MAYKITNEMGLLLLIVVVAVFAGSCSFFLPSFASSAGLLFLRHGITDNEISFRCALCTAATEQNKNNAMFCQQICVFVYLISREKKNISFRFVLSFFLAF